VDGPYPKPYTWMDVEGPLHRGWPFEAVEEPKSNSEGSVQESYKCELQPPNGLARHPTGLIFLTSATTDTAGRQGLPPGS
jgi:hypothetical protein